MPIGSEDARAAGADDADSAVPHRELADPRALRAIAHPVRLALLEQLALLGPSTATELAERFTDQSPANCSWHLRQLARYGFIEEAGSGPGRQRRWKLTVESTTVSAEDSPELARAAAALDDQLFGRAVANRRAWQDAQPAEAEHWREASFSMHGWAWLTAAEMATVQAEFSSLIERHIYPILDRFDPAHRPPGSRPAQLVAWLVPTGPEHRPPAETDDEKESR